jgi:hypothetical protein
MVFKVLSYSLIFPNFRWLILAAQPARALDVCSLVSWRRGMCHLSWSRSLTLNTFLRRRTTLRLWSRYLQEKTHRKLNSIHRVTTTTMTMRRRRMRNEDEDQHHHSARVQSQESSVPWKRRVQGNCGDPQRTQCAELSPGSSFQRHSPGCTR